MRERRDGGKQLLRRDGARGGELTTGEGEMEDVKQRERENEREIMRNDSHGGRGGRV